MIQSFLFAMRLVPCIIKADVSISDESTRHRIFMSPIIWQLLVACASNCFEEGKHVSFRCNANYILF